jgi:hypothetical protein
MENSIETNFVLFIHKTLLSFSYLERNQQKFILRDLQQFIHRLTQLFQNSSMHRDERRLKIIEILVKYLQKLHKDQISHLISCDNKDELLKQIDRDAYSHTMKHVIPNGNNMLSQSERHVHPKENQNLQHLTESPKRVHFENYTEESVKEDVHEIQEVTFDSDEEEDSLEDIYTHPISDSLAQQPSFIELDEKVDVELRKLEEKMVQKVIEMKRSITNLDGELDRKMEIRIKSNFIEIENQIKKCIRDSLTQLYKIEGETVDKMNGTISETKEYFEKWIQQKFTDEMKHHFDELYQYMNSSFQDSMKSLQKMEGTISERMDGRMEEIIQDIYDKLKDNFRMMMEKNREMGEWRDEWEKSQMKHKEEMGRNMQRDFEEKLQKLSNLFQTNFSEIIQQIQEEKLKNSSKVEFGTFHLNYHPQEHQIQLLHNQDVISSVKLNVKGMIGPKGPVGQVGKSPKIKKIRFSHDGRVKFLIESDPETGTEEYEVESDERVPSGPQGPKGEKGEPGTIYTEMKLNEKSVLRVDHENMNHLVVIKSLCVGEDSHCLQDKSLAIGGGVSMRSESFSLGKGSKTSDYQSIALYGTTHGKNAFSYRAQGVNDNEVRFGQEKGDIEKFEVKTRRFVIDADEIELKGKIVIQSLETKIQNLEKKIQDLQKRL